MYAIIADGGRQYKVEEGQELEEVWGDGDVDPWDGPYESNILISRDHKWSEKGDFTIRAKAKDIYGAESDWAISTVTIPRNIISLNTIIQRLLERFPNLFPIMRPILLLK